jgi:hypothetical protein
MHIQRQAGAIGHTPRPHLCYTLLFAVSGAVCRRADDMLTIRHQ